MFMIIVTISDKTAMIDRRHFIELRYHRRYQKPYCEEGLTTQWSKEKGQTHAINNRNCLKCC